MSLDKKISDFLARTETKPAASKLESYAELIHILRMRRWTYVQIAQALHDEFGLRVHPTTIHAFVKVRAKRKPSPKPTPQSHGQEPALSSHALPKRPRFNLEA